MLKVIYEEMELTSAPTSAPTYFFDMCCANLRQPRNLLKNMRQPLLQPCANLMCASDPILYYV